MKRVYKITSWIVGGIILCVICVVGYFVLIEIINPNFKETRIFPDENSLATSDTIFNVNGIHFKMIGVKGGKIDCRGLKKTIDLDNFYIGETEVTQELWTSIMGYNPSIIKGDSQPVENVDLIECLKFVNRLDSLTGQSFYIPTYPHWLYAAHLNNKSTDTCHIDNLAWHKGNADNTPHAVKQKNHGSLGIYDMFGNVAEWTISGSDPLFIVAGGSFNDEKESMNADYREIDHGEVRFATIGLRLILYSPEL